MVYPSFLAHAFEIKQSKAHEADAFHLEYLSSNQHYQYENRPSVLGQKNQRDASQICEVLTA